MVTLSTLIPVESRYVLVLPYLRTEVPGACLIDGSGAVAGGNKPLA
jgi:hypothetical protein